MLYASGSLRHIRLTAHDGEACLAKPYRPADLLRGLESVAGIVATGTASPPFPQRVLRAESRRNGPPNITAAMRESLPYRLLWEERRLVSVANLTRQDGLDFLRLAPEIGIVTSTTCCPLDQANQALADLRAGRFEGAAVLVP